MPPAAQAPCVATTPPHEAKARPNVMVSGWPPVNLTMTCAAFGQSNSTYLLAIFNKIGVELLPLNERRPELTIYEICAGFHDLGEEKPIYAGHRYFAGTRQKQGPVRKDNDCLRLMCPKVLAVRVAVFQ